MTTAMKTVDIWDVVRNANEGDPQSIDRIEQMLIGPESRELLSKVGNLNAQALESILQAPLGDREDGTKAILKAKLEEMRMELGWNDATDLQRLAIERVVHGWIAVHFAEMRLNQYSQDFDAHIKYLDDRLCKAQKRYLASIRTLATLRKMNSALRVRVDVNVNSAHCAD